MNRWLRHLCGFQGIFYLLTGVWPLISIRTFKWVSGEKTDNWTGLDADHWLVYTVGVLIAVIGATLLFTAWRGSIRAETAVLAIGSAAGLTSIDVIYVARGVILPVYLLDAAVEVVLILCWLTLLFAAQRSEAQQKSGGSPGSAIHR